MLSSNCGDSSFLDVFIQIPTFRACFYVFYLLIFCEVSRPKTCTFLDDFIAFFATASAYITVLAGRMSIFPCRIASRFAPKGLVFSPIA